MDYALYLYVSRFYFFFYTFFFCLVLFSKYYTEKSLTTLLGTVIYINEIGIFNEADGWYIRSKNIYTKRYVWLEHSYIWRGGDDGVAMMMMVNVMTVLTEHRIFFIQFLALRILTPFTLTVPVRFVRAI